LIAECLGQAWAGKFHAKMKKAKYGREQGDRNLKGGRRMNKMLIAPVTVFGILFTIGLLQTRGARKIQSGLSQEKLQDG
jgi:hypothetical protein